VLVPGIRDNNKRAAAPGLRTRTSHLGRAMLQRLANPAGGSRPVFLVGCGRSGTTLVASQLARSWQVDLFNENHPQAFDQFRLRGFPVIAGLARASHARISLFKPILDTHLSVRLLQHFAGAQILFAFRHYSDVISSAVKYFGPDRWQSRVSAWLDSDFAEFAAAPLPEATRRAITDIYPGALSPEAACALYWLLYNRLFFDLGLNADPRVRLVNYEDVVVSPRQNFQAACQFLGVRYDRRMAQGIYGSSVRQEPQAVIEPTILSACDQLWQRLQAVAKNG
jgi:hypothetical protein